MQVDSSNIQDLLPQIIANIKQAHFIAFDCEFTGLVTQLQRIEGSFPNHLEFYQRIKETALNFRIIQLGIVAFEYREGIYIPHVYNFYVSPHTFTPTYNNIMICEVESLQFLAKNHLDFGRVFKNGIKTDRIYSKDIIQQHQNNKFTVLNHKNMFLAPDDQQIVSSILPILQPLIEDLKKQKIVNFQNKTIFHYFKARYPLMLFDKPKKNMQPFEYNVKFREDFEKKKQFKMEESNGEEMKMEENVEADNSLRQIFITIIEGRKPLIGHFPNLDLGLIFQTFLKDLPETYDKFCAQINYVFPWIFDTKTLSRRLQTRLKGLKVDLASLFKACSNPKLLQSYSNFSIKGLEEYVEKQHEAGYDAFITGCSFIGMANFLVGEPGKVNFESLERQNKLLYSRFSGEVSINGNEYCSNAMSYNETILIQPFSKMLYPEWQDVAEALCKFGSLTVHEDHGQIYYVFQKAQKLTEIIYLLPGFKLKRYCQRVYPRARTMYHLMS